MELAAILLHQLIEHGLQALVTQTQIADDQFLQMLHATDSFGQHLTTILAKVVVVEFEVVHLRAVRKCLAQSHRSFLSASRSTPTEVLQIGEGVEHISNSLRSLVSTHVVVELETLDAHGSMLAHHRADVLARISRHTVRIEQQHF